MSNTDQQDNCRSALFEKLPPDLRRAVNVAIIEHCPPNFRAIWMQFELGKFGVSYYSLYRYARRLRDRVNLSEAAGLAVEEDPGLDEAIQKLAARRLFELLLNTDGAELNKEIAALLTAHGRSVKTKLHERRIAEESHRARARLDLDRDHLRLKTQALEWAREARARPDESPPLRLACSEDAQPSADSDRGPQSAGSAAAIAAAAEPAGGPSRN
jgi:hypothetical protein